jgi:hypothetical protein
MRNFASRVLAHATAASAIVLVVSARDAGCLSLQKRHAESRDYLRVQIHGYRRIEVMYNATKGKMSERVKLKHGKECEGRDSYVLENAHTPFHA